MMHMKFADILNRSFGKCILLVGSVIFLASCRLVIISDETGYITSASGVYDCELESCAIPIEELFAETFTAVAADGYRFIGWNGICKRSVTNECLLYLIPLPEEFSEYDGDVELSANFESTSIKRAWFRDKDEDNYGTPNLSKMAYEQPFGFVLNKLDCHDQESSIHPGVKETADGRDNNCNGRVDEGFTKKRFYIDADSDGFGDPEVSLLKIRRPAGYVRNRRDCNDGNAADNPSADEVVDGRDNDCDGSVDEVQSKSYPDVDGDGFGAATGFIESLEPVEGYVENNRDCDDNNEKIFPGAEEAFDSVDNDCDGDIDEGFVHEEYFRDVDGDGFGDRKNAVVEVTIPPGYVTNGSDNCIHISNPTQADIDEDGIGDACDPFTDTDRDGTQDSVDNCPEAYNPFQIDTDEDGIGDYCDEHNALDLDNDGVNFDDDNCPETYNPKQRDEDEDGLGDYCDEDNSLDPDYDEVNTGNDNCPETYNPSQVDSDEDGLGDACDEHNGLDPDEDEVNTGSDNCPETYNPSQTDSDDDGIGDACDNHDNRDVPEDGEGGGETAGCSITAEEQSMLETVNATRSQARECGSRGFFPAVSPLAWNCKLETAAVSHSMDMANNNFFSHTGSNGESVVYRLNEEGYVWSAVGENIAAGTPLSSVSAVVQAWIESAGHCANLMQPGFTELGAAKYSNPSSTYNIYWTQVFGRPR